MMKKKCICTTGRTTSLIWASCYIFDHYTESDQPKVTFFKQLKKN